MTPDQVILMHETCAIGSSASIIPLGQMSDFVVQVLSVHLCLCHLLLTQPPQLHR